ncbi:DUF4123 domain-containing protein [Marinobacter sp. 1-3A]|uniref:DUF4123 domain-containing protein n=1 Tax=Marinobacter sp. 1-3A TaxID=2582920 RepID=UPI00190380E4|nr:DUF4123 domain-containing protein [Marinobacter sp. 1-3A]MBK1872728.1 DUF4123 domain-containing protein [Marinobacter sp. 1-3A]
MSSREGSVALDKLTSNTIRYLVLESGQRTPITKMLYEHAENPEWVYLFADTEWQLYLAESPVILKASQQSSEYQWALTGLKNGQLNGLILESEGSFESIAKWLRARLKVRFDGQRQGLLRFYDPQIWHQLAPTSKPGMDVVERVIYWFGEPEGKRWHTTEWPDPITMLPMPTLSDAQWKSLSSANL